MKKILRVLNKIVPIWYVLIIVSLLTIGTFLKIENTPFDFKEFHEIGERINDDHEQLKLAGGYDHSFMVKDEEDQLILYDKETGRKLTMTTTLPCIQVYTGNFLSGGCNG